MKRTMRWHRWAIIIAAACAGAVSTSVAGEADTYTPARENLETREWFQDAKFGVFLHWGLYSQLGGAATSASPNGS